ncbi:hypothetical protein B0T14DRAFT_569911 [Immersiella caudata]|uniref:Uncharacterized protein n=1 Tax=Immersiella caudata TaxID=314043 RepID=A0AA39WEG9_9PEZI|nr:hypothetical protein B0T14DRAFT_569911 [Immersiella caudata]
MPSIPWASGSPPCPNKTTHGPDPNSQPELPFLKICLTCNRSYITFKYTHLLDLAAEVFLEVDISPSVVQRWKAAITHRDSEKLERGDIKTIRLDGMYATFGMLAEQLKKANLMEGTTVCGSGNGEESPEPFGNRSEEDEEEWSEEEDEDMADVRQEEEQGWEREQEEARGANHQ